MIRCMAGYLGAIMCISCGRKGRKPWLSPFVSGYIRFGIAGLAGVYDLRGADVFTFIVDRE